MAKSRGRSRKVYSCYQIITGGDPEVPNNRRYKRCGEVILFCIRRCGTFFLRKVAIADLLLDGIMRLSRKVDELYADTHAGHAIPNFATHEYFDVAARQLKSQLQDRSLDKRNWSVNEHPVCANVRTGQWDIPCRTLASHDKLWRVEKPFVLAGG